VDSEGKPIQLSKEHIEFLKTENMLEDEINKWYFTKKIHIFIKLIKITRTIHFLSFFR